MNRNFHYDKPGEVQPIVFEIIFAEKPGGGILVNSPFTVKTSTAVGEEEGKPGKWNPIKAYRLVKAVTASDTIIEIAKGSGIATGDFIARGKKAVKATDVDSSKDDRDIVTVTLGVEIPADTVLYQAAAASNDAAEPIYKPKYLTGSEIEANQGEQEVKLVNGANVRKETVNASPEVLAMLNMIETV